MDVKYLNYVITIAKERNLHSAADKLYISQPSLSYFLTKLEKEIGTRLFKRTPKELILTEAGKLYVETAQTVINQRNKLYRDISNLSYQSHLSIATTSSWGDRLMRKIIPEFKQKHPDVLLEISETFFPHMNHRLKSQEIDICLASMIHLDFNYSMVILSDEEIVMVVPREHPFCQDPLSEQSRISAKTLVQYLEKDSFMFTSKGSTSHQLVEGMFETLQFYPKVYGYFDNVNTIRALVADGNGVSFLPASSIEPPVDDIRCFYVEPKLIRKHVLAYRKTLTITPIVEELFDMMQEYNRNDIS